MNRLRIFLLTILAVVVLPAHGRERPPPGTAAIASAHPLATAAGHEILEKGGNAFDAAMAGLCAACVAEPVLTSLGGGGFLLAHQGGAQPAQVAFVGVRVGVIHRLGNHQAKDRVSEKLKPLVRSHPMVRTRSVRERRFQQRTITKSVPDSLFAQ